MTQTTTQKIKKYAKLMRETHTVNVSLPSWVERVERVERAEAMAELLERAALIFETVDKGKYWLEDFKKFQEGK